ncbi:RsmB/NOP family class I SAM-dependent RNA methyltransferase [Sagittula salina]|uniref:Methyltransferase domain-containing protein n=1 Tax=Sagittula salina TaxID=2820268 RepID=A0A940S230_9RHOB|nr:transcription antitermination factor NusB [Sagittula salina]MBP0481579.1 methyltransferase domain-containing protein [Sagittula salina]
MSAPHPARLAALDLLDQVLERGLPLSEDARLERLAPAERATAARLAAEVLRGLERADKILSGYLRKTPEPRVRNILRLGCVELCTGGAAHGVVSDCVEIAARGKVTQGAKGLVNAVLRKVAAEGPAIWGKLRVPRLPKWLRKPLVDAWGPQVVAEMERAHFNGAPVDVTLKGARPEGLEGTLLPTGSIRLENPGQVSVLPGFSSGDWWVQDAAAALPVKLLDNVSGLEVLDMCAAPGGKTLQLAAAGAKVTSLDLSEPRMVRVRENLDRCGLEATLVVGDALEHQGQYDAILLDAPCSATGTIRRHPDLPHAHQGEKISELIGLQSWMLDHALSLLKPGGRLVFATCSLIPDEGECQVEEALARHPGLRVLPPEQDWVEERWRSEEGGLRLRPDFWPQRGGMDGFYMAVLTRS